MKDKWHLFCVKNPEERDQWLRGFEEERLRVMTDLTSGFNKLEYRSKIDRLGHSLTTHPEKHKGNLLGWSIKKLESNTIQPEH